MNRDGNSETFSLVLTLALKTLWYSVVFGALVLIFVLTAFPAAAEDFYAAAGSPKLSFQFAEKATGDDADAQRLVKTADKAAALMESYPDYAEKTEYYCLRLLLSGDAEEYFDEYDRANLQAVPPEWHVNVYDSYDYYSTTLYRARLARGITDLFVQGENVAPGDIDSVLTADAAAGKEAVYILGQLSLYAAGCGEEQRAALLTPRLTQFCAAALGAVTARLDADNPSLDRLYALRALYRFYNACEGEGGWGAVEGFAQADDIASLYEYCFEKYCDKFDTEDIS